jgi:8-oxo-dGTP pyrophosphatase MutT (NUDIX family)
MPENPARLEPDGASVILYTNNKVLLHKRDSRPRLFPNRWSIFGGGIEPDETPEETACRELKDELGYQLSPQGLEPLGRFRVCLPSHRYIVHYFRAELAQDIWDILLTLNVVDHPEREGEGIALFSHDEIDYLNLVCQGRVALERHFRGKDFGFID